MLQVENISFGYRRGRKSVLDDFSLVAAEGWIYGLLGKNGAGKSTLLYLMSGLPTPGHGKVKFHDVDVRRRLPVTLQDMFLVPEEFELLSHLPCQIRGVEQPVLPPFQQGRHDEVPALLRNGAGR